MILALCSINDSYSEQAELSWILLYLDGVPAFAASPDSFRAPAAKLSEVRVLDSIYWIINIEGKHDSPHNLL